MRVYATDGTAYWKLELTPVQAKRLDNGMMISCGLTIPRDCSYKQLEKLTRTLVSRAEYNHSGCLSRCTEHGDTMCQW